MNGLHSLRRVALLAEFSDDDLRPLEGLKKLELLNLAHTLVTDAGLAHLRGMTALRELDLTGRSGVTDAGLASLAGLRKLQTLGLRRRTSWAWGSSISNA